MAFEALSVFAERRTASSSCKKGKQFVTPYVIAVNCYSPEARRKQLVCVSHQSYTARACGNCEGRTENNEIHGVRSYIVLVVYDSHIQRIVPSAEETMVKQEVSLRSIKFQTRSWSQRGTKVNRSHHGANPLIRPREIQIATKSLSSPTNREHRKLIDTKTISLGTNHNFYCLECCQSEIQTTDKTV